MVIQVWKRTELVTKRSIILLSRHIILLSLSELPISYTVRMSELNLSNEGVRHAPRPQLELAIVLPWTEDPPSKAWIISRLRSMAK